MDEFEELVLRYQSRRFLVVDPIGGKGDLFIHMGLEKKLEECGITFDTVKYECAKTRLARINNLSFLPRLPSRLRKEVEKGLYSLSRMSVTKKMSAVTDHEVILLRGGAYLNDIWGDYDTFENVARYNPKIIIVAPHSFFFETNFFKTLVKHVTQEVYLFCREKYSRDLLNSYDFPENIHVCLSHDTAMYLSREDIITKDALSSQECSYDLVCTRKDEESAVDWNKEILSIKNAAQENSGATSKILVGDLDNVADSTVFLDFIARACKVFTDRLHVAILSTILGKDTFLYPNSYHKNKGVYEFSLSSFPNIRFIDTTHNVH